MRRKRQPDEFLPVPPKDLELLLALRSRPLHGYAMIRAVEEQSGGRLRIELGSLYRMLHRLERAGLIAATAVADEPLGPGRERVWYRTTRLGNAVVAAEVERLRSVLALARRTGASEARP